MPSDTNITVTGRHIEVTEAIRDFAMQVDPTCINRMGGKLFRMTRNGMNWQPGPVSYTHLTLPTILRV